MSRTYPSIKTTGARPDEKSGSLFASDLLFGCGGAAGEWSSEILDLVLVGIGAGVSDKGHGRTDDLHKEVLNQRYRNYAHIDEIPSIEQYH